MTTLQKFQSFHDKRNFIVHYESAFNNKFVSDSFLKFLKSEHNPEPWQFLLAVQKFKEMKNSKEKFQKINEIIEMYLKNDSDKQINISAKVKNKVMKNFKQNSENSEDWMLKNSVEKFFDPIVKIVKDELYHDPWKR